MDPMQLVVACAMAFAAVFLLLSVLALMIQAITTLFPAQHAAVEPAVVAAISTTVASRFPGARVTRIEEEP